MICFPEGIVLSFFTVVIFAAVPYAHGGWLDEQDVKGMPGLCPTCQCPLPMKLEPMKVLLAGLVSKENEPEARKILEGVEAHKREDFVAQAKSLFEGDGFHNWDRLAILKILSKEPDETRPALIAQAKALILDDPYDDICLPIIQTLSGLQAKERAGFTADIQKIFRSIGYEFGYDEIDFLSGYISLVRGVAALSDQAKASFMDMLSEASFRNLNTLDGLYRANEILLRWG